MSEKLTRLINEDTEIKDELSKLMKQGFDAGVARTLEAIKQALTLQEKDALAALTQEQGGNLPPDYKSLFDALAEQFAQVQKDLALWKKQAISQMEAAPPAQSAVPEVMTPSLASDKAPKEFSYDEAGAWMIGWNACRDAMLTTPPAQPAPVHGCHHKRYSVDAREGTGTCHNCGAEGRMQFVVGEATPTTTQAAQDVLHDTEFTGHQNVMRLKLDAWYLHIALAAHGIKESE
jgi:hypothetical protein